MDKNIAVTRKRTAQRGIHIGLVTMMSGAKRMRPKTEPTMVRPVRRSKMDPVIRRVRTPKSWFEFATWCRSFRSSDDEVVVRGVVCVWDRLVGWW